MHVCVYVCVCVWRTPSYNTHIQPTAQMKDVPHFHYSTTLTTQLQQYVLQLHCKLLLCSPTALSPTYKEKKEEVI
jgi:predicted LPLAT superfamily acyltransferase